MYANYEYTPNFFQVNFLSSVCAFDDVCGREPGEAGLKVGGRGEGELGEEETAAMSQRLYNQCMRIHTLVIVFEANLFFFFTNHSMG